MGSSNETTHDLLSTLLPTTSFTLPYAVPLLLLSILLTFAGAFFTLDRTRTFPRHEQTKGIPHGRHGWLLPLEGGLGGVASGYVFGLHLATFLSLLIPGVSTFAPLSSGSFVPVWLLSSLACAVAAGRWKFVALGLSGISGFATLALSICVIVHPSRLTCVVLTSLSTCIGLIFCVLPIPRYARVSLRLACSALGSFGVILSIALLARLSAWSDVWQRLWITDGIGWGTSQEKGLSAAFCLLLSTGLASDWFIHVKLGQNPDEKWDRYLADYVNNLPNDHDRAGIFRPVVSFWDRWFGHRRDLEPLAGDVDIFPTDVDYKSPIPSPSPARLTKYNGSEKDHISLDLFDVKPRRGFLRKGISHPPYCRDHKRSREVQFKPLDGDGLSSSDDDSDDDATMPCENMPWRRPSIIRSMSPATLVAAELGKPKHKECDDTLGGSTVYEEDVANQLDIQSTPGDTAHSSAGLSSDRTAVESNDHSQRYSATSTAPTFTPVPATPSLIRAIDRIAAAQEAAYGRFSPPQMAQGITRDRDPKWDTFWQDVRMKAGHAQTPPHQGAHSAGSR